MMPEVLDPPKATIFAARSAEQQEMAESMHLSADGLKATIRTEMQHKFPSLLGQRVVFTKGKGKVSPAVSVLDLVEKAYFLRHTRVKDGHSTVVRMSISRLRTIMQLLLPCLQEKKTEGGGDLKVQITPESPKCLQDLGALVMEA